MEKEKKEKTVCTSCGGSNILYDAWVRWNEKRQKYEVESVFDNTFCVDCDDECGTTVIKVED